MMPPEPDRNATGPESTLWLEALVVGMVALVFAAGQAMLDREPPFWDEYYHLLAARSWASDGTFAIGTGSYERAAWLSASVGWVFRTFGEGMAQARMIPAVIQAALVVTIFAWVYRHSERLPAWAAALMLAGSPVVLVNLVFVRFYVMVALLVMLCAVALYGATRPDHPPRRRLLLLAGAIICAWLAYRITPLTRVWLSGVLVWLIGWTILQAFRSSRRRLILTAMGITCVAVLGLLWSSGWIEGVWQDYRTSPGWSVGRADDARWYARGLMAWYPTLLTLFPLAALLSTLRRPALATLCLCGFTITFIVLSGAGPKAERYVAPVLPFFFVVWGLALAEIVPILRHWAGSVIEQMPWVGTQSRAGRLLPSTLVLGVFGFVLLTNWGFTSVSDWMSGQLHSRDRTSAEIGMTFRAWDRVAAQLRDLSAEVDVVVTSNTLQMLYHVGDYDYGMRPTVIDEVVPPRDFGIDPRDGRPAISTLASLMAVVDGHPTGLIVGERWRWGHTMEGFTREVEAFVQDHMEAVELSPALIGYRWGPDIAVGRSRGATADLHEVP